MAHLFYIVFIVVSIQKFSSVTVCIYGLCLFGVTFVLYGGAQPSGYVMIGLNGVRYDWFELSTL